MAKALVANCRTDSAKAFSIFRWITRNINYDMQMYLNDEDYISKFPPHPLYLTDSEYNTWYYEQMAAYVFKTKLGVCEGYSRLFKAMCDDVGLECIVISGYAKRSDFIGISFASNHAWNAIKYNGKWHLLDATWASGHLSGGKFTRSYEPSYYDTPPSILMYNHYPEKSEYAFLPYPSPLQKFFELPLLWPQGAKEGMQDFLPSNGRIYATKDSVIEFRLNFNKPVKEIAVTSEPGAQSVCYIYNETQPNKTKNSRPVTASKTKLKISKKEKDITDAVFNYADTALNYKDSISRPPESILTATKPQPKPAEYTFDGKTLLLKYRYLSDSITELHFFANDHLLISYAIAPKQ